MNRNLPRLAYRPREAAEVTGLSLRFLYYAIQQKDLPTIRVGRCRLITEKALRDDRTERVGHDFVLFAFSRIRWA